METLRFTSEHLESMKKEQKEEVMLNWCFLKISQDIGQMVPTVDIR